MSDMDLEETILNTRSDVLSFIKFFVAEQRKSETKTLFKNTGRNTR